MKKVLSVFFACLILVSFVFSASIGVGAADLKDGERYIYVTDEKMTVDGKKEDSYNYGTKFVSDLVSETTYEGTTSFSGSFVWDGTGKVYCFVECIDPEVVANDELWAFKWWHCDSWQMYIDYEYTTTNNTQWTFVGNPDEKYLKTTPDDWKVVMTDKGFNVEFCFDYLGSNFKVGDKFGYGPYYNECYNYSSTSDYKKVTLKSSSFLNPVADGYKAPGANIQDCMILSAEKIQTTAATTTAAVTTTTAAVTTTTAATTAATTTKAAVTTTKAATTTTKAPDTTPATGDAALILLAVTTVIALALPVLLRRKTDR